MAHWTPMWNSDTSAAAVRPSFKNNQNIISITVKTIWQSKKNVCVFSPYTASPSQTLICNSRCLQHFRILKETPYLQSFPNPQKTQNLCPHPPLMIIYNILQNCTAFMACLKLTKGLSIGPILVNQVLLKPTMIYILRHIVKKVLITCVRIQYELLTNIQFFKHITFPDL